jgi:hypothetical protein
MTGDVIKSFLVGLGFGVDDASLSKFNKSIQSATLRVTALYAAVNTAAAGIVAGIADISEGFEKMGYEYRIIAPAINKALVLRRELLKAYSAAGINITKVVQNSVKLNMSLAKTKFAFEAIYKSVGSRFFELLTKQSDIFRQQIYKNMPKIQNALERFVKFIFKAFEAVTTLGMRLWSILTRVYDFFVMLDKATNGWSTILVALTAAWYGLNLAFLATPLGMIIAGLTAILALFDDFKTWQEGGKSLFDWGPFVPVIDAVTQAVKSLWGALNSVAEVIGNLILAFYQLFHSDNKGFWDSLKEAGQSVLDVFSKLWDAVKGLGSALGITGGLVANAINGGGGNVAANIQNNPAMRPLAQPVGVGGANPQTNQHVSQQTSISVSGSADANAVGKAVAGEQGRVNFDMVRNMKGATR